MAGNLKVSVIIVNYKTPDLTIAAIKTLQQHTPWLTQEGEIILVDNASEDGSVERFKQELTGVRLLESKTNTGFAGGNNYGMREAQGKYILLLNSDTVSIEDSIKPMFEWMEEHPAVGVASIQLLYEDQSLQETGGYFPTLPRVFAWMFFLDDVPFFNKFFKSFHPDSRSYNSEKKFYTKEHEMDWLTGAYFFIRKELLKQVGYFDEAMFMYAEEMEYCYRIKQAGFRCYYIPLAKIVHLRGKSSPNLRSPLLGEYKNIMYFYKKHMSAMQVATARILLKAGAILRVILFGWVLGRKELAAIYAEAYKLV